MDTEPVASAVAAVGIGRREAYIAGAGAALALATLTEEASAAAAAKSGWDQCLKCSGLVWVNAANGFGVCPAGGTHQSRGLNYKIIRIW
jgi:hypothetical protein